MTSIKQRTKVIDFETNHINNSRHLIDTPLDAIGRTEIQESIIEIRYQLNKIEKEYGVQVKGD